MSFSRFLALQSIATLLAGLTFAPGVRADQALAPEAVTWSVTSTFGKSAEARSNLSGAACVPTTPRFSSCLIVNDDKKYAQFFSLEGDKISPKKLIRLADSDDDPDAEGTAYADGYFYITGSHGRSRNKDKPNDSSYVVFRFPVDPKTGEPPFVPTDETVIAVESSTRLRDAIRNGDNLKDYYDQPLAKGGANVEGVAVKNGRMYLGFRGPSVDNRAFILSVDAAAVFTKEADLKAKVVPLTLGDDTGIRDLAAVEDGILVLAGPTRNEDVPYAVWLWNDGGGAPKRLGQLDLKSVPKDAKAEILLVLAEETKEYRVLVMFDGIENGGPMSFKLPR
jgi:hypothetical protein